LIADYEIWVEFSQAICSSCGAMHGGSCGIGWHDEAMKQEGPVVIAGAGIAGLVLAVGLSRFGCEAVVYEREEDLASAGAGISLWPNALAALDAIGLGDSVRTAGAPVASGGIQRPDGSWIRVADPSIVKASLGESMVAIHRADLLGVFASRLEIASIRFGVTVSSFASTGGGVKVVLNDGSEVDGCALVGADGIGSVVANELQPGLVQRYSGYTAWRGIADFDVSDVEPSETWGPGGEFGFVPIGSHQTYWFATEVTPEAGRGLKGELARLFDHFGTWHTPIPELLEATKESAVLRHDIYDRDLLKSWSRGPVIAIGDAAHPMRPHLGQGGCQSIEDGVLLAATVNSQSNLSDAFVEFARKRERRIRPIIRQSAVVGKVIHGEGPLTSVVRELGSRLPMRLIVGNLRKVGGRESFNAGIGC
jgi:2-polyprenyl-6-methoxyphenol hydroxylase-like FAD-dependent oxidoreductase